MSDDTQQAPEPMPMPDIQIVTQPISEETFLASQQMACDANERVAIARVDAEKEIALAAATEQRRAVAMSYALASFGLSSNAINPPAQKPDTNGLLRRAASIAAFLETGQTPHEPVISAPT